MKEARERGGGGEKGGKHGGGGEEKGGGSGGGGLAEVNQRAGAGMRRRGEAGVNQDLRCAAIHRFALACKSRECTASNPEVFR